MSKKALDMSGLLATKGRVPRPMMLLCDLSSRNRKSKKARIDEIKKLMLHPPVNSSILGSKYQKNFGTAYA